ncbi:hypothetical protein GE21DRAFT_1019703 [Neurospora crassa]|nr:hypothetical protein GE21DRAFT_1019703 [Neurospora crassa]
MGWKFLILFRCSTVKRTGCFICCGVLYILTSPPGFSIGDVCIYALGTIIKSGTKSGCVCVCESGGENKDMKNVLPL